MPTTYPRSNTITKLDYDFELETLDVTFKQGRVYRYFNVNENTYIGLLKSFKPGAFLAAHIKPFHEVEKIESPDNE